MPSLIANGTYRYAYLGLSGNSIGPGLAEALGLPANNLGVYVAAVLPAARRIYAGLQGGREIVRAADGHKSNRGGDSSRQSTACRCSASRT